ncbi:cytochrome-c peroxidase [Tenacibaculum piscium]|uniref:Cytochrome c551 peroxidase n=1 Tax=Tenacibaculum piscium TaxID=1458515 RepID=A0A2H1YH35_9FLAO|nr:cytochrome c peroxidase [Tenacibaculum piscium]MBE7630163.1 c-type cytochrome [Tenacibaculum piscium]MBE7671093.1 c-type cytochrome [Tenacibaculum piscium]MBE7685962.1 c-type cytochrome [Tenacibaculum piscium]MBE7690914.1 c-type cytochrome [Tenacibaculum piscium]SOS74806.1 Cytochrome c551 peroxidase [Tenacibaculum piscium]
MKNKHFFNLRIILIVGFAIFYSCSKNKEVVEIPEKDDYKNLLSEATRIFSPLPANDYVSFNELTNDKVFLGKLLFEEKRLSKDNTISCASCHDLENFGADTQAVSKGVDGKTGTRNAPTVFNSSLHIAQFWDARAKTVEEQAGMPILNPVEMAMESEQAVVDKISKIEKYQDLFKKAYPNQANPINFDNLTKAIGAFERTLLMPSKFDEYLKGNQQALNQQEKKGLFIFMSRNCISCHDGPLVGGSKIRNFGSDIRPYWEHTKSKVIDKGVFLITNKPIDLYAFKVPSLRNVAKTAPYFHDGSVAELENAIRIMGKVQLDKKLEEADIKSIKLFLETLTSYKKS